MAVNTMAVVLKEKMSGYLVDAVTEYMTGVDGICPAD